MSTDSPATGPSAAIITVIAWAWVLIPFLYGLWELLIKVIPLFAK